MHVTKIYFVIIFTKQWYIYFVNKCYLQKYIDLFFYLYTTVFHAKDIQKYTKSTVVNRLLYPDE